MGRPRKNPPKYAHDAVRILVDRMQYEALTHQELTEQAGIGINSVVNWANGVQPGVAALDAALQVVGYKLAVVRNDD